MGNRIQRMPMPRRPRYSAHPDANQGEIVQGVRAAGLPLVLDVSQHLAVGDVFTWGYSLAHSLPMWMLWEIKTAEGKLTEVQRAFMALHEGAVLEARDWETILRWYGRLR